jgi:hypothetical protein
MVKFSYQWDDNFKEPRKLNLKSTKPNRVGG